MNKLMLSGILAFIPILAPMAQAVEQAHVPVTQVFAPRGFDDNDSSEIVIAGYLPSLCYKAAKADTVINGKQVQIDVTAYKINSPLCAQMIVPFLEVARLGILDKGKYEVVVNPGYPNEKRTELPVTESLSSTVDDFVYANVSSMERIDGTRRVILKGENPGACFELDEIRLVSNGMDTYSVLPILKRVAPTCNRQLMLTPFEYEFTVPSDLASKQILLHVRVMNGKSVNMLFKNQ